MELEAPCCSSSSSSTCSAAPLQRSTRSSISLRRFDTAAPQKSSDLRDERTAEEQHEDCERDPVHVLLDTPIYPLMLGGYASPGYNRLCTFVLNLVMAIVLTPDFGVMNAWRTPIARVATKV
jgi:hypothetical protein